jgi:hypothetical protein
MVENQSQVKWMRSKFSEHIKCDHITSNVAEVWNNWVKDIKDLPIVDLADPLGPSLWNCMQGGE